METKENNIEIIKEPKESNGIEETIQTMLEQVMEEKDDQSSFDFDYDEIEDESFKISRHSTRHQTTAKSNIQFSKNSNNISQYFNAPNFDRANKRNLTVNSNQVSIPSFNNSMLNSNFLMGNPSLGFSNCGNNKFFPNLYNNCLQNINNNNNFGFNNNLNQSFQSYHSFNPQYSNNYLNSSIDPNTFIRSSLPISRTVVYHNQGNILNLRNNNMQQANNNFYRFGNNNIPVVFNGNKGNNGAFFYNLDMDFKRGENRKKTYDTPINLQNNIINSLKNNINVNNNICFNKQIEEQAFNNNTGSLINNNIFNNINNTNDNTINELNNTINNINVNDNTIYELKHSLERTGKIDYYIYNLIKGKFLQIIKNHKGSKIFQKYLKSTHSDDILHQIFIELSPNLEEIIIDPYANYFCKKFFTYLNQNDRIDFLKRIESSFIKLSSDSIGTYPIQSIIEYLNSKTEKMIIINAIKDRFEELIYDPFGCHVIEKLLVCLEDEYVMFIYAYIFEKFLYLSNNSYGICIIKKILSFTHKKKLHEKLKNIVKENGLYLIQQSYGNFVIQVIIECWDDYKDIINIFKGHFFNLSLEKYASNVIERCIEKNEDILNDYINEIISSNCIYDVMKSNYGNYVIQKAIKLAKGEYKNKFVFNAAIQINKLNDNKLIQKWKSILMLHIKELTPEQIQELKSQNYFGSKNDKLMIFNNINKNNNI